jgi:dTDP-4-dehydrorhamnose reductase
MTLLITGGSGQLGSAVHRLLPDAAAPTRREVDLARPEDVSAALARFRPGGIINCAAYTAVDRAEQEEAPATAINGTSVGAMAGYAAAAGIPFVTFSTDYVFDGSATEPYVESSPIAPLNAYGRSKAAGERAALEAYPGSLVIRTSWLVSATHPNFVATMLRLARRQPLRVVDDQVGCPTMADDLAAGAIEAMKAGVTGILHITNRGTATWFELARTAVEVAGLDPSRVTACTTADYPTPARRPRYSVLGSERRSSLGLQPLPHWRASLPSIVARLDPGA